MKNKMMKLSAYTISLIIIAVMLVAFGSSCKKTSDNASFTGTYYGTLGTGLYSEADTVIITTGTTSTSVVMVSKTSRGSIYTINGTVSGSQLNIPSQQVYIASSAATYTTSGSGTLTNSKLVINYVFTSTSGTSNSLTFTGAKK